MKEFYHATDYNNLTSILSEGIHTGCDGVVYLAETAFDAYKFLALRGYEKVVVFKIQLPDTTEVSESFDHSYTFFKCRAWYVEEDIPNSNIIVEETMIYTSEFSKKGGVNDE